MITKNDVLKLYAECLTYLKNNHPEYYVMVKKYTFGFGNKKRSFGTCYYGKKQIKIHMYLSQHQEASLVKDTILHEMAHAIDKEKHGYSSGHGINWKKICNEIGCLGERTKSLDLDDRSIIKSNYVMVLINADLSYEYVQPVHRITKKRPLNTIINGMYLINRKKETMNKLMIVTYNDYQNNHNINK